MNSVKTFLRRLLRLLYRLDGSLKIKRVNKKKHTENVINVLFVCQYLPSWDKNKSLYYKMNCDPSFDPYILCIPSNISGNKNDTYSLLSQQGYTKLINPLLENGTYMKLSKIKYDYIFYDRPYNNYLPTQYKTMNAAKYGKVCLHPYALGLSKRLNSVLTFYDFFHYISVFFADSIDTQVFFDKEIVKNNKYKKAIYLGYLGLSNVFFQEKKGTNLWDFSQGKKRIIWAPRWSTDSVGGGSNFFKYRDDLLKFANSNDVSFLIRPHPKMFNNFVNTGLMTQSDVDDFKNSVAQSSSILLDETPNYIPTFWESDLLISDFSTIIIEYILTGKPIIYCNSDIDWDFFNFAAELISCCYVANSFQDVHKFVKDLTNGIDPLRKKREEFVNKYAKKEWVLSTDTRFLDFFKNDFFGRDC